jgi:hypothetical protein
MPSQALAWGFTGHTFISRVAAENLPAELPAFVRSSGAVDELTTLGPEEDRLKGAGSSWDDDSDPGHFLDIDDSLTVFGVVKLYALPKDMNAYAQALAKAHTDPYKAGYLPYTIMDGWEQLRKDFAIWRVDDYMAAHATTADARVRFAADRSLRESLTLRDIGVWGHFVGDAAQPLHISVHFNGWGDYPNPKGYTTSHHMHSMFESNFVSAHVTMDDVRKHLAPYKAADPQTSLSQTQLASIVGEYLTVSARAVPALYDIEKAGGFANGTRQAVDFTSTQLERGASMLRDLVALAWEDSLNQSVGYPEVPVRDILSGKVVPTNAND